MCRQKEREEKQGVGEGEREDEMIEGEVLGIIQILSLGSSIYFFI